MSVKSISAKWTLYIFERYGKVLDRNSHLYKEDNVEYLITVFLLLIAVNGCGLNDRPIPAIGDPYHIDYSIKPSSSKHIKWVGVPGGQLSVDKDHQVIEFVGYGGARYDY